MTLSSIQRSSFSEFTEDGYRKILKLAKEKYNFSSFSQPGHDRDVLWRHDLDGSVHRALSLAKIECDEGVLATYFFMLKSRFYDLYEPDVLNRAREIVSLGHHVGLHFDAETYPNRSWGVDALESALGEERDRLGTLLKCYVEAVSFHNPGMSTLETPLQASLAGMTNAYGAPLRDSYGYCSDSNGYWRFDPLPEVLTSNRYVRLQVLTHPEWWTPEPMAPRERIERCVNGRAAAAMRFYDDTLARAGRLNIDVSKK